MSSDLLNIIGHSHSGSLHLWKKESIDEYWNPRPMPTGHFEAVTDLSLYPAGAGSLLASVSYVLFFFKFLRKDSTTRIHAKCSLLLNSPWYEIARPQVHGYEMIGFAWVPPHPQNELSPPRFISAGDEKVFSVDFL